MTPFNESLQLYLLQSGVSMQAIPIIRTKSVYQVSIHDVPEPLESDDVPEPLESDDVPEPLESDDEVHVNVTFICTRTTRIR